MRNRVVTAFSLCALSTFFWAPNADAVPGLNSSNSVKEITKMLKQYTGTNAPNIYQIEQQLRDRPSESAEALVNILDTNDVQLKIHASQLLQRISMHGDFSLSNENIKTLVAMLNATDIAQVQTNLLATLGSIGPKNDLVKNTIVFALKNGKEASTRKAAVDALSRLAREEKPSMHAASTAVLLEVLKKDDSPSVRGSAASALGTYRDNPSIAVPALLAAMDDNYLQVRTRVVQSLGGYGKSAESALPKIIEALKTESDQSMRYNCVYALRSIGPQDPAVTDTFISLIDEPAVGDTIVTYIQDMGPKGVVAVPKLIVYLSNPSRHKRMSAARALGSIGPEAKDAIPALTAAAQDNDPSVRRSAEDALRLIRPATTDGAQVSNQ